MELFLGRSCICNSLPSCVHTENIYCDLHSRGIITETNMTHCYPDLPPDLPLARVHLYLSYSDDLRDVEVGSNGSESLPNEVGFVSLQPVHVVLVLLRVHRDRLNAHF